MKIGFFGDIVGRSGRDALLSALPQLRQEEKLDAVVVNGENAAAGFGITGDITRQLLQSGVDVITTGNHVWDQKETLTFISNQPRLLRPINYPTKTPGQGVTIVECRGAGKTYKLAVINVMGRLYMDPLDDPFKALEKVLENLKLKQYADAILVDVHAEATSEKLALGYFLDGKVSLVVGTHTHIPTRDGRILPQGTAYQTDLGMCGDYDSIIGMDREIALSRFLTKIPTRLKVAEGPGTISGVIVETDDSTGLARSIKPVTAGRGFTTQR